MDPTLRRQRRFALAFLAGGLVVPATSGAGSDAAPPSLAIVHVTVVDADGSRPDQTVVVVGGRLTAVGPSPSVVVPRGARAVDGRGKYLIPGLWDMHVHTAMLGSARLPVFLLNGVTSVRDLGGPSDSVFRWAKEVAEGARVGPRIVAAGRTLTGPGGQGAAPHVVIVKTAAEARRAVDENADDGAAVIKVWSTIPREAYFAAIDEATKRGLSIVGHLPVAVSLREAVDAGQRGIEHQIGIPLALTRDEPERLRRLRAAVAAAPNVGAQLGAMVAADAAATDGYDAGVARLALAALAAHGVWVCPTLTDTRAYTIMHDSLPADPRLRFIPGEARRGWIAEASEMSAAEITAWRTVFRGALRLVGELKRAGVRLLAGTDAGSTYDLPGFDLHNELALLVRAGLTPLEALTAGTSAAAEAAGLRGRAGLVAVGQAADLVLLDANPLADITNTRRIAGVMVAGRYLSQADLAQLRRRLIALDAGSQETH